MGQKDLVEKNLEGFSDVFADIINALLYQGEEQVIAHPEALLRMMQALTGDDRYEGVISEVLKEESMKGGITMCELLDKYEKRGIEKGIEKGLATGENRMAQLIQKLMGMERMEDLMKATEDTEYRSSLFQELGIV